MFLVEGTSEQDAMVTPFSQYLKEKVRVEGEAFYCDVTTVSMFPKSARTFVVRSNVKETVRTFVLDQIERKHTYTWQDLAQIVHIVDTDGAFIPDDRVLANEELNGIAYYADHIEHAHPADIIERNYVKAAAIRTLAFAGELVYRRRAVPYRLFFMSRNLEHALFGIGNNVDGATKERLSREFAEACRDNPQVLVERLCAPDPRSRRLQRDLGFYSRGGSFAGARDQSCLAAGCGDPVGGAAPLLQFLLNFLVRGFGISLRIRKGLCKAHRFLADGALGQRNDQPRAFRGRGDADHAIVQLVGQAAVFVACIGLFAKAEKAAEFAQRHAVTRADLLDVLGEQHVVTRTVDVERAVDRWPIDARVSDIFATKGAYGDGDVVEHDLLAAHAMALGPDVEDGFDLLVAVRAECAIGPLFHRGPPMCLGMA